MKTSFSCAYASYTCLSFLPPSLSIHYFHLSKRKIILRSPSSTNSVQIMFKMTLRCPITKSKAARIEDYLHLSSRAKLESQFDNHCSETTTINCICRRNWLYLQTENEIPQLQQFTLSHC